MFVGSLLAATLIASVSLAQEPIAPEFQAPPPKLVRPVQQRPAGAVYNPRAEPGVGLRRYGLGVTLAGVVLGIGGVIAAYTDPCGKDGANGSDCRSDVRNAVAMTMGVASLGLITGGVISMGFGHAQRRRARLELANSRIGWGVAIQRDGGGLLMLRGRF